MGNQKKKHHLKSITVEFKISMHCNECERNVAKIISKFKGVETFMTDMNNHRVVITGRIDPQTALKKLKKKTGKRVEIVAKEDKDGEDDEQVTEEENEILEIDLGLIGSSHSSLFGCGYRDREKFMIFSDENPNSMCSIL